MVGRNESAKSDGGIDSTDPSHSLPTITPTSSAVPISAPTSAETAKHLLSPSTTTRPRSSTVNSHTSAADSAAGSGYESSSSEDSMLSFWSDDDSDEESMTEPESAAPGANVKGKEEKEDKREEKKKREEDRSKVLEQAGLKLRREPPGIPMARNRRRAPAAPGAGPGAGGRKRRAAPTIPQTHDRVGSDPKEPADEDVGRNENEGKLETVDAYARYENYLAQSQAQANQPRPQPQAQVHAPARPISPPQSTTPTRSGRSASLISQPSSAGGSGGGRFSGLISRIMAPSTSTEPQPRKSISIVRVESEQGGGGEGGGEKGGGTWTSLVDPSVLGTMSDTERKRQEVSLFCEGHECEKSSLHFDQRFAPYHVELGDGIVLRKWTGVEILLINS